MDPLPRYTKTRIAPTPSGYLHRGNAYSFLLTAALARQTGARLLLRIDDMDQQRVRPAYLEDIFDTLHFLGIRWDEGPSGPAEFASRFAQIHRLPLYEEALDRLRASGQLFACTCTRTQVLHHSADGGYPGTCRSKNISLDAPGVCWRLFTGEGKTVTVKNGDGTYTEAALPPAMQDFVVRKKDGMPAYQVTSIVDDLHFAVDLVVRGEDLWPSTVAQVYLASLLGGYRFMEACFYHHPLLTDAQGKKLSKSAGAEAVRSLRQAGWQAADFFAEFPALESGDVKRFFPRGAVH